MSSKKHKGWWVAGSLAVAAFFGYAFTRKTTAGGSAIGLGSWMEPYQVLKSETADAQGYEEQYNPPDSVWFEAMALAQNVINPAMAWLGYQTDGNLELVVSSWYRSPRLNEAVGGSPTSDHLTGSAADISVVLDGVERNDLLMRALLASGVQWSQLILEKGTEINPAWIHVSFDRLASSQKNEILRYDGSTYTDKSRAWADSMFL